MRVAVGTMLLALLIGAEPPDSPVESIELRLSGWTAIDISVNSAGQGRYHISEPFPTGRTGDFRIAPRQFEALLQRLSVYRRQAVPLNEQTAREAIERQCPEGTDFIYDRGAIWLHWSGPQTDEHYLADLGCDPEGNAARNDELISILQSLPVPFDW